MTELEFAVVLHTDELRLGVGYDWSDEDPYYQDVLWVGLIVLRVEVRRRRPTRYTPV